MLGPPEASEADGLLVSGWSVHGGERSQAALHIMPEWAEVLKALSSPLLYTLARDEANACS